MDEHQRDAGVEQQEPDEDEREDEPSQDVWPDTQVGDADSPGT